MPVGVETRLKRLKASITFKTAGRVSDSVTRRIGAENVGLRYLATLNKLTRPTRLIIDDHRHRNLLASYFESQGFDSLVEADCPSATRLILSLC